MSVQVPSGISEAFGVEGAANAPTSARLTWRRLRRNRSAMIAGILFLLVVFACFPGASIWASAIAHRGPDVQNLQGRIDVGGEQVEVVAADGTPIGPGLRGEYMLGADSNGRDLMVRILYGGRTSLTVGILSALLCTFFALLLALPAGYFGGKTDSVISSTLDLIWSFPVYLLAVALSASLVVNGINIGWIHIGSSSLLIPIVVIAVVFVPYLARPIRAEVMALRDREFVQAAAAPGAGATRIMVREILPNVFATTLVLFTLIVAGNILVEAALSFLGVGVPVLTPSWGNIIQQGYTTIVTAPWQTIAPGLAIMFTAITLNVFGDGLRDALDPQAEVRGIEMR